MICQLFWFPIKKITYLDKTLLYRALVGLGIIHWHIIFQLQKKLYKHHCIYGPDLEKVKYPGSLFPRRLRACKRIGAQSTWFCWNQKDFTFQYNKFLLKTTIMIVNMNDSFTSPYVTLKNVRKIWSLISGVTKWLRWIPTLFLHIKFILRISVITNLHAENWPFSMPFILI
jgi:hypothetical protein